MSGPLPSRVLVAGGTGLVGRALTAALEARGVAVEVLSRDPARLQGRGVAWDALPAALEGVEAVVNLAGAGLAERRWTEARKRILVASRVDGTTRLAEAMATLDAPPPLVNASAVGYYGLDRGEVDEGSPRGRGFLAGLCEAWEAAADRAPGRVVKLRLGAVLAPDGGALPAMARPLRWGLGAVPGDGGQGFPWIHLQDAVGMLLHALADPAWAGPINAVAPHATGQGDFLRILARRLHRPLWPLPAWLSRAGAGLALGELARELLLEGPRVHSTRARALGFAWRFPEAEAALADLFPASKHRQEPS